MTRIVVALTLATVGCAQPRAEITDRITTVRTIQTVTPEVSHVTPAPSVRSEGQAAPRPAGRPEPVLVARSDDGTPSDAVIVHLIHQIFRDEGPKAVRVFRCESHLDPSARNGQHRGIAQVATIKHAALIRSLGYTADDMYQPLPNLKVARKLYDASGWNPWRACA